MKTAILSCAIFGLLTNSVVYAMDPSENQNNSEVKPHPHHFYFGPEFQCYQLNTHIKDVKVHGTRFFWGFRLGYEYLKPKAFYFGIDLATTSTETDFKASKDREHISWHKADRGFGNLELRLGYTFAPEKWMVTPFLGFGLYDVFAIDHHDHQGFSEDFLYGTGGARAKYAFSSLFDLGLNLKVFRTFHAEQRFKYEGGKVKEHHNMWGGEIGTPLIWHIGSSNRWDVQLEPYFLKLDFSEVQNIYGTRLLFGYIF